MMFSELRNATLGSQSFILKAYFRSHFGSFIMKTERGREERGDVLDVMFSMSAPCARFTMTHFCFNSHYDIT